MADPIVNDQSTTTNPADITLDINFDDIPSSNAKENVNGPEIQINNEPAPVVQPVVVEPVVVNPVSENIIEPQIQPGVVINPFPKAETAPVVEVAAPVIQPVIEPIVEPIVEETPVVEEEIPMVEVPQAVQEKSDLKIKFDELSSTIASIYKITKTAPDQTLEILGANNDKVSILYQITTPDGDIHINKVETDHQTEEEDINELAFIYNNETNSVSIILDDVLLFDEVEHLQDDTKKKMQVVDKLNKFIFLASEQLKKLEKEIKEKEAEENERRRLQDIFRNF